jgi:hypothetical protein
VTRPDEPEASAPTHLSVAHIVDTLNSEMQQAIFSLHLEKNPDAPILSDDPHTRRLEVAAICRSISWLLEVPIR